MTSFTARVELDEIDLLACPARPAPISWQDTLIETCKSLTPLANHVVLRYCYRVLT